MIFQPCGGFEALGHDTKVGASVLMVVFMSSKFEKLNLIYLLTQLVTVDDNQSLLHGWK
jgi:hypothetical protein